MNIAGFKEVDYQTFLQQLSNRHADYIDGGGSEFKLADKIEVKAIQTVRNCFSPIRQIVADKVLTNLMNAVELNGLVIWMNGIRIYFIKK